VNHNKHSYLMIGLLVAGAALFFTGIVGGRVLFLLWPVACMAMMFFMMRGMMGMQGGSDRSNAADRDIRTRVETQDRR